MFMKSWLTSRCVWTWGCPCNITVFMGNAKPWSLRCLIFRQTQMYKWPNAWISGMLENHASSGASFQDTHTKQHLPGRGCPAWWSHPLRRSARSRGDVLVIRCHLTWMIIICCPAMSNNLLFKYFREKDFDTCPWWMFQKIMVECWHLAYDVGITGSVGQNHAWLHGCIVCPAHLEWSLRLTTGQWIWVYLWGKFRVRNSKLVPAMEKQCVGGAFALHIRLRELQTIRLLGRIMPDDQKHPQYIFGGHSDPC